MASKLTIPELTTSMKVVINNNLKLSQLDKETKVETFLEGLSEEVKNKLRVYEQQVYNKAELNFISGCYVVRLIHDVIKESEGLDEPSTLFVLVPQIKQLDDNKFLIYSAYLTLGKEDMELVKAPYKLSEEEKATQSEALQAGV